MVHILALLFTAFRFIKILLVAINYCIISKFA